MVPNLYGNGYWYVLTSIVHDTEKCLLLQLDCKYTFRFVKANSGKFRCERNLIVILQNPFNSKHGFRNSIIYGVHRIILYSTMERYAALMRLM